MPDEFDGLIGDAEPSPEQLAPEEGDWYQPYPERPRLRVLPESRWPKDLPVKHGQRWPQRFYVETAKGTIGLVPWPGSQVVWPWEMAWTVDLFQPSRKDDDFRKRDLKQ